MESQRKLLILILRHLLLCIDTSTSLPDKDTRIYFHRRIEFFSKRARTRLPVFSPSIYVCMHRYFCTLLPIRIHKHIHTCTHVDAHKHACAHIERNTCAERKRERERCQCDWDTHINRGGVTSRREREIQAEIKRGTRTLCKEARASIHWSAHIISIK